MFMLMLMTVLMGMSHTIGIDMFMGMCVLIFVPVNVAMFMSAFHINPPFVEVFRIFMTLIINSN